MGLDVTAYRKIKKLTAVFDADGEPIDPKTLEPVEYAMQAYINPGFQGRADDIEDRAVYDAEDNFGFRAGSYGGYNHWREELAKLAGYPVGQYERYGTLYPSHCVACWDGQKGPFSELINFSDCEGIIGTAVASKLAKDFADFQAKADEIGGHFREKYEDWRKAFEMAADAGAVRFH